MGMMDENAEVPTESAVCAQCSPVLVRFTCGLHSGALCQVSGTFVMARPGNGDKQSDTLSLATHFCSYSPDLLTLIGPKPQPNH